MTRFIFITGGVVSSIGKGIAASSIGALLQSRNYKVSLRKLDPYLNIDPGTMSPTQHGEVFVTEDGAETDLDLGHYERFTGTDCTKYDNVTSGKIYATLLQKERKGDYLGATVQVIPHVTDLIKEFIFQNTKNYDFVICEIGGTVGDIEALPYFEAIRQIGLELGRDKAKYVHVTLLPYIPTAKELKTKPTQHSVKELRAIGIQPDFLLCRSSVPVSVDEKNKISLFCNVPKDHVIQALDTDNIYNVPIIYAHEHLDEILLDSFNIKNPHPRKLEKWEKFIANSKKFSHEITIAIVGKYHVLDDAYLSLYEAIKCASATLHVKTNLKKINARDLTSKNVKQQLEGVNAILVPGGFGIEGIEGKICASKFARENNIPYLGICLGMQIAVIEFARNVCGLSDAHSTEFVKTPNPVIALMREWANDNKKEVRSEDSDLGGTMRLGAYLCRLKTKKLKEIYGTDAISERHRHRYEFNNNYKELVEKNEMKCAGMSPDGKLVEIIELENHPWFVGVQFHPELKSRPFAPHPLFTSFIKAGLLCKK